MTTTVTTQPPEGDTIPVADLLDLVRKYTERDGWCDEVERYLGRLGLEFDPSGCQCCDFCKRESVKLGNAPRFTLVEGAPETVTRVALVRVARDLEIVWPDTAANLLREAAQRFGLKVEATR